MGREYTGNKVVVTIVESLGSVGEAKLTAIWEKWTCLLVCKQGCKKIKGNLHNTEVS